LPPGQPARATSASSGETPAVPSPAKAATSGAVSAVTLGGDELTAGIPGQGPLTSEQIQAWLADPRQHEPLEVKLPLGLDVGQATIQGLADNPLTRAKIELGRQLYFDARLSSDGTISCASCHMPTHGYAAATQFGVGVRGQQGNRNSPVSYNRILSSVQFWDGRAATLEAQAVGPIANAIEMANTHALAVKTLQGIEGYRLQFQAVFGGDVTIDRVGQAIASFERAIVTGPSPYDYFERLESLEKQFAADLTDIDAFRKEAPEVVERYEFLKARAAEHPMSASAKRGRDLFFGQKASCTACHLGANFSDEKYHNLGVGMDKPQPDLGRFRITEDEKDRGAFKTPTVRNVALTAPYMHDGSQKTLEEVIEWYDKGGHANPHLSDKIKKLNLTAQEKADLVEFLKALTGTFPKVETARLPQ
jgi:cytochrome c peroxidase